MGLFWTLGWSPSAATESPPRHFLSGPVFPQSLWEARRVTEPDPRAVHATGTLLHRALKAVRGPTLSDFGRHVKRWQTMSAVSLSAFLVQPRAWHREGVRTPSPNERWEGLASLLGPVALTAQDGHHASGPRSRHCVLAPIRLALPFGSGTCLWLDHSRVGCRSRSCPSLWPRGVVGLPEAPGGLVNTQTGCARDRVHGAQRKSKAPGRVVLVLSGP